eukprot:scaffold71330_cov32-Tisochrysis_lutea.AAC.4
MPARDDERHNGLPCEKRSESAQVAAAPRQHTWSHSGSRRWAEARETAIEASAEKKLTAASCCSVQPKRETAIGWKVVRTCGHRI